MEKTEEFMNDLLVEFECPVCTQFMHPPIRQCAVGHSLCNECYRKLKVCPTCRHALTPVVALSSRSFVLEKLHSKLHFPCRYAELGCTAKLPGYEIEAHEFQCHHGGNPCPLKILNDCAWFGRGRDIVDHCKLHHPNNFFSSNIQRLTCSNFIRDDSTSSATYYMVFFAFREIFKCVWEINFITGFMRWCVFRLLGEKVSESSESYHFIVDLQNQLEPGHKLAVKGFCPNLQPGEQEVINNDQFVFTHYNMVKRFCRGNDLLYTIKIVKQIADFTLSPGMD